MIDELQLDLKAMDRYLVSIHEVIICGKGRAPPDNPSDLGPILVNVSSSF